VDALKSPTGKGRVMAMKANEFQQICEQAKVRAVKNLAKVGIEAIFTIKVRSFPEKAADNLAQYRSRTQFTSRPIFWINERLPEMVDEAFVEPEVIPRIVEDSIYHEYGHVMFEFLAGTKTGSEIIWRLGIFGDPYGEEFAESFAAFMANRNDNQHDGPKIGVKLMDWFREEAIPGYLNEQKNDRTHQ